MYNDPNRSNKRSARQLRMIRIAIFAVLLAIIVVLAVFTITQRAANARTAQQLTQRIRNCVSAAQEQVSRMSNTVNSSAFAQLSRIRQYVYNAQQLNEIYTALYGSGFVDSGSFTALFAEIESYETLTQTASSSTLEVRTRLQDQLGEMAAGLME